MKQYLFRYSFSAGGDAVHWAPRTGSNYNAEHKIGPAQHGAPSKCYRSTQRLFNLTGLCVTCHVLRELLHSKIFNENINSKCGAIV